MILRIMTINASCSRGMTCESASHNLASNCFTSSICFWIQLNVWIFWKSLTCPWLSSDWLNYCENWSVQICGRCFWMISFMLARFFCAYPSTLNKGHSLYIFAVACYVVYSAVIAILLTNRFRFASMITSFFFFRKLTANSSLFLSGSEISTKRWKFRKSQVNAYLSWSYAFHLASTRLMAMVQPWWMSLPAN